MAAGIQKIHEPPPDTSVFPNALIHGKAPSRKTQSRQAELNLIQHKVAPRAFETESEMNLLASSNKCLILN